MLAVTGCQGAGSDSGSPSSAPISTTASADGTPTDAAPAGGSGRTYKLSKPLCGLVDQTPLTDILPFDGGKPLADQPTMCATARLSKTMTVSLGLHVDVAPEPRMAQRFLETAHRLEPGNPTDIAGAGAGAFFTINGNRVKLFSYDGNLNLQVECEPTDPKKRLPADMPERLAKVAAGTYDNLAS